MKTKAGIRANKSHKTFPYRCAHSKALCVTKQRGTVVFFRQ